MGLLLPSGIFAQETVPSPGGVAEMERVIVTGSNIPTAQEVGPNPVDTYRPADIEKLGIRNSTDLLTIYRWRWARLAPRTVSVSAMALS